MSNLSITNLLALLQNPPLAQQQVADASSNGDPTGATPSTDATGQNLPTGAATTTGGAAANGASTPVISSDMTAVLLQMQQSQEMTDAQALLYGGATSGSSGLLDHLDGNTGSTTDPTQALLDQLTGTSGQQTGAASLMMSSNQTLLDYLNALDTNGSDTTSTATDANIGDPSITGSQTSASDTAMMDALYSALGLTSAAPPDAVPSTGTLPDPAAPAVTTG